MEENLPHGLIWLIAVVAGLLTYGFVIGVWACLGLTMGAWPVRFPGWPLWVGVGATLFYAGLLYLVCWSVQGIE